MEVLYIGVRTITHMFNQNAHAQNILTVGTSPQVGGSLPSCMLGEGLLSVENVQLKSHIVTLWKFIQEISCHSVLQGICKQNYCIFLLGLSPSVWYYNMYMLRSSHNYWTHTFIIKTSKVILVTVVTKVLISNKHWTHGVPSIVLRLNQTCPKISDALCP